VEFRKFEAGPGDDGRRLDRVLRRFLLEESLSQLYSSVRRGFVRVNDKRAEPGTRICSGDVLSVASFLLSAEQPAAEPDAGRAVLPYQIIFKNDHFLVINKPYDVPVQQSGSERSALGERIADAYRIEAAGRNASLSFTAGPLHRLDRKTTGVLFFSWSLEGARWFSEQMAAHRLEKKYLGLVQGTLSSAETWEDLLEKEDVSGTSFRTVRIVSSGGKAALTKAEPVAAGTYGGMPVTLVQFTIGTGRMHQIRAQSSFHHVPLLGDTAYGGMPVREAQDFFLHAREVYIPANTLGLPPVLEAPLSAAFAAVLHTSGIVTDSLLPSGAGECRTSF